MRKPSDTLQTMVSETIPQLKTLSLTRKRRLIHELVAQVYGEPIARGGTADALRARIQRFREQPGSARSWADVKAKLRKK